MTSNELPRFVLSSEATDGAEALTLFALAIGDIFAIRCVDRIDRYRLVTAAWHLGAIMIGTCRSSALHFERSKALVAQSGVDHLLVQLYVEGGFAGEANGVPVTVTAGDIVVFDLSQTLRTQATDFANLSLLIPRASFEAAFDDVASLHGTVLSQDVQMAAILGSYLQALAERMPTLPSGEAHAAAAATAALVINVLVHCLRPGPTTRAAFQSPFRTAALLIERRIHDPNLQTADIAAQLGMSRATLYRVFQPVGGVADYIRRRRLIGAALDLSAPTNRYRRAGEIGFAWGFASETAFHRTFKDAFGITPNAARRRGEVVWAAARGDDVGVSPEQRFARWVRLLHH